MSAVFGVVVVSDTQPVLDLYSKLFVVVLKITNPDAGVVIESRWDVVIRGGKNPFEVELTSNCADGFISAVDIPIPTWALVVVVMASAMISAVAKMVNFICCFLNVFPSILFFGYLSNTVDVLSSILQGGGAIFLIENRIARINNWAKGGA